LNFKLYVQSHDKNLFTLAYPFFLFICSMCGFSFCDNHQFIDVSRCENSPWSSGWWRFRCLVRLGSDPAYLRVFF